MVTHGCRAIVAESLALLAAHTEPRCELIVVDSASPDDTAEWITSNVRGARLIKSEANIGYGAGSNLGAAQARGELLLFLNPDVCVLPGWLTPLINAMALPEVGAAGPQILYPNGVLQAAGSMVFRSGHTARYGDGDPDIAAPGYRHIRAADYLSGACLMVPRRLFEEMGRFDPAYGMGYFEDVDLCFTLAARGYRALYVPASVVHHVRDASGGSRTLLGTVEQNHRIFVDRWHEGLRDRPGEECRMDPRSILRLRDIRASQRVLLLGDAALQANSFLARDRRSAVTVAGQRAEGLSDFIELVETCEDWGAWFDRRRDHYDVVAGRDPRFDALVAATQPRACRTAGIPA